MQTRDVNEILARARGASVPAEWSTHVFPHEPLRFNGGKVFSYLFFGFFLGWFINLGLLSLVRGVSWLAGRSIPDTGRPEATLLVLIGAGGWVSGIGVMLLYNLSHSMLVITDHEAISVTFAPLGLRWTKVLEFRQIRGMVVQVVIARNASATEPSTYRLAVRRANARRSSTWDIRCCQSIYQEIVAHFELDHANDPQGLSAVKYTRLMDD